MRPRASSPLRREFPSTLLWPVDKLILAYFGFAAVVLVVWWRQISAAPALLAAHLLGAAVLLFVIHRPSRFAWWFHNWYAVVYVSLCYKEMEILVPAVRRTNADQWLADLDYSLWHANPTVWLERIQSPLLTEYMQLVYTLFVPAVLWLAFLLWKDRRHPEFQYYAFLIALGYLTSYIGYLIVPARGPRFLLVHLQNAPLQGLWLFANMQGTLDRLESIAYDCFPSGHTELTILAWWSARRFINPLFWPYFAYTSSIIFATVYLRYHYTIDVFAGVALAAILLIAAPGLYRKLSQKGA